ncbi:MAG: YHYH protein [Verrucomicrobiota bacterium]
MKPYLPLLLSTLITFPLFAHVGDHGESDTSGQVMLTAKLDYDNEVDMVRTDSHLLITSNGIPEHSVGKFPNAGNPNRITPQQHNLKVPLNPRDTGNFNRKEGAVGIALNGVPMEPGTAETWQGDRSWRMEAIVDGKSQLGLDQNNAHVQPTGSYHYHGVPHGLIDDLRRDTGTSSSEPLLIGWAADGYAIYYLKSIRPSYQLKSGSRPDGPGGRYDGTYTADFEFVSGSGDLDEANGKFGPTPQNPEGAYHYYVTERFPFLPRVLKGEADESFAHPRGGGPGGRPGMRPGGSDGQRRDGPPPGERPRRHPDGPPPHLRNS